jgi:hypothetical protein
MAAESLLSVRRLEDKDVRDVFECLHLGMPPPPHLPFRIVPVGPNGLKLSPPSHEFPGAKKTVWLVGVALDMCCRLGSIACF